MLTRNYVCARLEIKFKDQIGFLSIWFIYLFFGCTIFTPLLVSRPQQKIENIWAFSHFHFNHYSRSVGIIFGPGPLCVCLYVCSALFLNISAYVFYLLV